MFPAIFTLWLSVLAGLPAPRPTDLCATPAGLPSTHCGLGGPGRPDGLGGIDPPGDAIDKRDVADAARRAERLADVVVERTETAGVTSLWLRNGVLVHLRPMATERVVIACTLAGGAVLEDPPERGLSEAAAGGWKRPGRDEDGAPVAAGGLRVRAEVSPEGVSIRCGVAPERVEAAVEAIAAMLNGPEIDSARLDRWRAGAQRRVAQRQGAPELVVAEALMDLLIPDGVPADGQPLTREQIAAIQGPQAEAWLRERIARAPLAVAIAGELSDEARAAVLARLGELPARERIGPGSNRDRRRALRPVGPLNQELKLKIPKGQAHLVAGFTGPDVGDLDQLRPLTVAMEVARQRLEAMRDDGRLSASMVAARTLPGRVHPGLGAAMVMAKAPDDPESALATMSTLQLLLDDLVIAGPSEDEVRAAASALVEDARKRAGEPEYWASLLSIAVLQRMDPASLGRAAEAYTAMTRADVQAALKRWCVGESRFSLLAMPGAE